MNAEDAVEEWAAQNRAVFERMLQTLSRANEDAAQVEVTTTSADGGVSVVVSANKLLRNITIDEKAYGDYDEKTLATLIVDLCQRAKRGVVHAQWRVIDEEFGVTEFGR